MFDDTNHIVPNFAAVKEKEFTAASSMQILTPNSWVLPTCSDYASWVSNRFAKVEQWLSPVKLQPLQSYWNTVEQI